MSFSVLSNNLKYSRSRCWLPTEFIVNHMHLYCLSLGKQLSLEETSYSQICTNSPPHQAYFMRQKSPPKHRCRDQTVDFPTRRQKRLCFTVVESQNVFTTVLQPSSIWLVFHGLHSYKKWFWVRAHSFFTSNLESAWHAFGKWMEVEDKVHLFHEGSVGGGSS